MPTPQEKKERKIKAYALAVNIKGKSYLDIYEIFPTKTLAKQRKIENFNITKYEIIEIEITHKI